MLVRDIVTRCLVDALQQARQLYDESAAKLTVLTDATNQKISLTKHLANQCNMEVWILSRSQVELSDFCVQGS